MALMSLLNVTDSLKGPFVSSYLTEIDFLRRIDEQYRKEGRKQEPKCEDEESELLSNYAKYVRCLQINGKIVTLIDQLPTKHEEAPKVNIIIRTEAGKFVWTSTMSLLGNMETREDPAVQTPRVQPHKEPAVSYEIPSGYIIVL